MYVVKFWPIAAFGVVACLVGGVGFVATNPDTSPSLPVWEMEVQPHRDALDSTHSVTLCSGQVEITNEGPPAAVGQPTLACASCRDKSNACDCGANCQCSDCSCAKKPVHVAGLTVSNCGPGGCKAPAGFFPKTPSFTVELDSAPPGCGPEGCQAPPAPVGSFASIETLPPPQCADLSVMRELTEARIAAAVAEARLEMYSEMAAITSQRDALKMQVDQMKERVGEFKQLAELFAANKVLETKLEGSEKIAEITKEATEGVVEAYHEMFKRELEAKTTVAEMATANALLQQQLSHMIQGAGQNDRVNEQLAQFEHLIKENNILRTHIGVLEEELFQLDSVKTAECPEPQPALKR